MNIFQFKSVLRVIFRFNSDNYLQKVYLNIRVYLSLLLLLLMYFTSPLKKKKTHYPISHKGDFQQVGKSILACRQF